jgi:hypothetical protein
MEHLTKEGQARILNASRKQIYLRCAVVRRPGRRYSIVSKSFHEVSVSVKTERPFFRFGMLEDQIERLSVWG